MFSLNYINYRLVLFFYVNFYVSCGFSSVWENEDDVWHHSHPQRVYLVFNGYTQRETEIALSNLNLTVNGVDIVNVDDDSNERNAGAKRNRLQDYIPDELIVRSGLGCNKGASKACTKACKKVLKNVCDTYKCTSGLKSTFKKECKRNCHDKFSNVRSHPNHSKDDNDKSKETENKNTTRKIKVNT